MTVIIMVGGGTKSACEIVSTYGPIDDPDMAAGAFERAGFISGLSTD